MKHFFLILALLTFSTGVFSKPEHVRASDNPAVIVFEQPTITSDYSAPVTVEESGFIEQYFQTISQNDFMTYGNTFGQAIEALKSGKMIKRQGHGENTFIYMQVPSVIGKETVPKMTSLPRSVKNEFERRFNDEQLQVSEICYSNQLAIVNPSNLITGYSPGPEDALADDWVILD